MKVWSFKSHIFWSTLALIGLFVCDAGADLRAQIPDDSQSARAEKIGPVSPQPRSAVARGASQLSPQQREDLFLKMHTMHEGMAASEKSGAPSRNALPLDDVPESGLPPMVEFPGNPGDLVFGRTGQPPDSSTPGSGSSLAEPVGANVGDQWYAAGNVAIARAWGPLMRRFPSVTRM
jgi:hypothetical protein